MAKGEDDDSVGDELSEVSETSWLERLGQSFGGIVFGVLLVIGACVLLFWNEGRAVKTARSLTEGSGIVQTVSPDKVDPANEGRLVYVTAMLATAGPVTDSEFGVKSPGVRLKRTVEMFQWAEESESESKKKLGGGQETRTTYKYGHAWSRQPVDSEKFHDPHGHINPQMIYRTRSALAPEPKLGAFFVPPNLLYSFSSEEALKVDDEQAQVLQQRLKEPMQAVDGVLYIGKDASQPAVGDFRITFTHVPLQTASVVAQQAGSTFEPYRTHSGGTIELISAGRLASTDMFKDAQDDNRMWTWLIRAGGCALMFFGFVLVMGPIGVLADVVPILGDIVGVGVSVIGLLFTVILAPVIVSIAWFVYRPVVALAVLAVGAALAAATLWLFRLRKARKAAVPA